MSHIDRRSFLAASAAALPGVPLAAGAAAELKPRIARPAGPVVISSGNGIPAVTKAMAMLQDGADCVDAVVEGVTLVENDPNDMSVGYGGLPNEDGVVELDSSVMHGPTHKAGAVAGIHNIKNPARVAREVLRRTDHVLIVGDGARRFATSLGFQEENLLTERARQAWVRWKANLSDQDDWLSDDQLIDIDDQVQANLADGIPFTYGTIHCAAVDAQGDVGAVTTTSGLSYKIPGRVGDSPIVGAGMFVDNEVGAGGSTGRGESVIQSCGAFQVVNNMANGDEPAEACLKVLKWIADHTRRHDLRNERGEPNFNVVMYAVRKDGAYGAACMRGRRNFAVHDGAEARHEQCAFLYE